MVQKSCHGKVAEMVTFSCDLSAYTALMFSSFWRRLVSRRGGIAIKSYFLDWSS